MEHWETLKPGGYRFVYDDTLFPPGTDTFLLSSLPRLRSGQRVCDLGCGTGLLGILLLQRCADISVTGVEILPQAVALGQRAARENGLTDRLFFRQEDLRATALPAGAFDLVVSNPPYFSAGSGKTPLSQTLRTARCEDSCSLDDICRAAGKLLRWGGSFCLVHKPERLADLCCALREAGMELKRLRFVCKTPGASPSLLLAEARRGGKSGVAVEAPLILQTLDGTPTQELDVIYFRQQEAST